MNIDKTLIRLLNNRGITSQEEIDEFFSEKPQKTYDPFLLHNMKEGVDLVLSAVDAHERICIYGDYDADGITSVSILMDVLGELTDNLTYYIPSRFTEGYGLNIKAINKLAEENIDLIITVDCGSVSVEEVEYIKKLGIKILVTDHHTIDDKIADCLVINPKQKACSYPCSYLAGCGVAFKLAQAIIKKKNLPKRTLTRNLDLVGVGTIGDIVPLVDENRTFAKYGIRAINTGNRENFAALIEGAGLKKGSITSEDISFVVVPHLNAAGRMEHAKKAAEFFRIKEEGEIKEKVVELLFFNKERKRIQNETYEKCKTMVLEKYMQDRFLLIKADDAHEGIAGIVAGKIKDNFGKPTAIITPTPDGSYKGTSRSIEGVDLYKLLKENEDFLSRFGGHSAACGFNVLAENIDALRKGLNESMDRRIEENKDLLSMRVKADLKLEADEVTMSLVKGLELLEPCGEGNRIPLFEIDMIPKFLRRIGDDRQYLMFTGVLDNGMRLDCKIWNHVDDFENILQRGRKVSIIGTLGINQWQGRETLQFTVTWIEE